MRTRIELGTSGSIDLADDVPYSLNFAVADIRTPDKRDASYSKTIKIPGSKQNNSLFAHIFEIDIDCNFNPNIKTPCIVYIDEIQQLKGFLQLLKIYINDEQKLEYEVTIKGSVGNIFTALTDAELTVLDFSAYDHVYNRTNQVASWTAPVGVGYVYPMIDYGQTNGLTYDVLNFFPAIYVKQYIDTIFAYAGYSYNSTFFNTTFFKSLIIPYSSKTLGLTSAQVASRLFSASLTVDQVFLLPTIYNTFTQRVKYNNEISDPATAYNPATWEWVVPVTGWYKLNASMQAKVSTTASVVSLIIAAVTGNPASNNGYLVLGQTDITLTTTYKNVFTNTPSVYLGAGTVIVAIPFATGNSTSSTTVTIHAGDFQNEVSNINVVDGDTLSLNNAIPPKIKIKDFLKSIINMFNLYIDVDKNDDTILNIEPRNDFYLNGVTIDWTNKLDVSKELIQEPMGALDAKRFTFIYTEDKDYYNKIYKDVNLETYGTQIYDVDNDFLTATKETKLIFSPTPLYDGSGTDRVVSTVIPPEMTATLLKGVNIRILYYGGVIATDSAWTYTSLPNGNVTKTEYPYAGHLDLPSAPTLDLNFGVPKEVFYNASAYTNNNLFNKYHKQFIEEITHKDSKIITGYFYLTPKDILTLDFRNQFFVDGHLLRLNKIYDYNPIISEVTKCEFIKIKAANTFVATSQTSNGGIDITIP